VTADATLRSRVQADLTSGIKGGQLHDAWGGLGHWTPVVKLTERDAEIVANYVVALVREVAS
jgi:hypothetical protein